MITIDLIIRTIATIIAVYFGIISWRKLHFDGIKHLTIGLLIDFIIRLGLLFLPHGPAETTMFRILLTCTATLKMYGMYNIYTALKKLNGVT